MLSAVNVQARGCEVHPHLRAHFEEKLHGLERLWSRLDDAQVIVSHERGHYVAEITLYSGGVVTRAEERAHDLRQAFDAATHKLQGQLKRYKEKVQHRARRQNNRDDVNGTVLHPLAAPGLAAPATIAALNRSHRQNTAWEEESAASHDLENGQDTLVRVKRFSLKQMSPEEAALQMDLLGHDFFVFRDADHNQVSVVYKRSNGGFGLIEPVPD